ncbi:unnamed protein product [Rotaria sp. Silwood1]|nr:unnamed protein product [Rotaria sp. Silwood1]
MQFLLCLFIFVITFPYATTSDLSTKFNVTIKIPGNTTSLRQLPYKTVHVKYTLPNSNDQWSIVKIEPFIQSLNGEIQQITVHICHVASSTYQYDTIWYNDETICKNSHLMLIYQWASYSSLTPYELADGHGFQFDKSKLIIFTVTYFKEQQLNNDQSGVILTISTVIPRFYMGTIVVGNKQQRKRFSCRISNYPRLLYGIQPLFSKTDNARWSIYIIRYRMFGRKIVQSIVDSSILSNHSETNMKILSADIFLKPGDYLIIECESILEALCKFLIFYKYKNIQLHYFIETDHTCQNNDYPNLFESIPSKRIVGTDQNQLSKSSANAPRIFLFIIVLLIVIWISIILGCVIMRHVCGLVNFRQDSSTQILNRTAKTPFVRGLAANDQSQRQRAITTTGDRIAQMDVDHTTGLMNG